MKLMRLLVPAVVVISAGSFVMGADDDSSRQWFTQKPQVADSIVRVGADRTTVATNAADTELLGKGPRPVWIWGPDNDRKYSLTKTFETSADSGILKTTCDNLVVLSLNGQRVTSVDAWQDPAQADIKRFLKPGKNVLVAEIENQGGPAGFILKLALTGGDETQYIVSDESWQARESKNTDQIVATRDLGKLGVGPWGDVFSGVSNLPEIPRGVFNVLPGFQVELLYTVPKDTLGSWVSIAFDDKRRLIASDQGGKGLCRITPPPIGSSEPTKVERLDVKITSAQGMLYAFDSLYLSVNGGPGSGLYRAVDTDGDDRFDQVTKLKAFRGGGEHGPHALRLSPDGKSISVICGNHTDPPDSFDASRIPTNWAEDLLLPRQWDANGHAAGRLAPGGWIAKTDPEGTTWEIFSVGYRNPYDMDFNADGELFAYDADMEWDLGTPWYRPTRVVHATSGSEFGWRSGTGKWPPYYPDSLPQLVDIGPGSPVGVAFGYGTKFPAKYQKALYICDWTFGTMFAIHTEPDGASYRATKEEFLSRAPLPLTDVAMGPDGALYFTVGGRGTQSELFRVTYTGDESTAPADVQAAEGRDLRSIRRQLEDFHRPGRDKETVLSVWPYLGHDDRHIRYAARVALEHQPVDRWQSRVFSESDPLTLINAAIALARQGDQSAKPQLLSALDRIGVRQINVFQRLELLRAYQLIFARMGEPDDDARKRIVQRLDPVYPMVVPQVINSDEPARIANALNRELSRLLVYLRSPNVIGKTVALLAEETEQREAKIGELLSRNKGYGGTVANMLRNQPDLQQVHYAFVLRNLKKGWTVDDRRTYFSWFKRAQSWSGGASFQGFLRNIDREAYENASEQDRLAIEAFGARKPFAMPQLPQAAGPGRDWTVEELRSIAADGLKGRDFENGRRMYAAARCVLCHRFAGDGGATGPDLTQLAGRFNIKDLSESLLDPSKVISDQYRASIVATDSGQVHTGRVVSESKEAITLLVNPEDATKIINIPRDAIDEMTVSKVSLMPKDLLKSLNRDEVLDLLAYLLSRGNKNDPSFRR